MENLEIRLISGLISDSSLDEIIAIENDSFTQPWSKENFHGEIKNIFSYAYAAIIEEEIIGYVFFWILFDELHIVNLAVKREFRNLSVASSLLGFSLLKSKKKKVRIAMLEVRSSNKAAICLYEKFHFRKTFVRENYYSDPTEDASIMILDNADYAKVDRKTLFFHKFNFLVQKEECV